VLFWSVGGHNQEMQNLDESLDRLYRGQTNVADEAKRLEMPLEELKSRFKEHACGHSIAADTWRDDLEPSWPWA